MKFFFLILFSILAISCGLNPSLTCEQRFDRCVTRCDNRPCVSRCVIHYNKCSDIEVSDVE